VTATALARALPDYQAFDRFDSLPARTSVGASPGLERATGLLLHGAHRLSQLATDGALADPWPTNATAGVRARYVANCLRELDTFLKGLLDQVAPSPLGRPRRHNAANRVHDVAQRLPLVPGTVTPARSADDAPARIIIAADVARLRALGRSRACLWHCHGLVRRPDLHGGAWMTAGWLAPASTQLRRYPLGERLTPDGGDLIGVGTFYRQLAYKFADA